MRVSVAPIMVADVARAGCLLHRVDCIATNIHPPATATTATYVVSVEGGHGHNRIFQRVECNIMKKCMMFRNDVVLAAGVLWVWSTGEAIPSDIPGRRQNERLLAPGEITIAASRIAT